jgi:hypothetical protein
MTPALRSSSARWTGRIRVTLSLLAVAPASLLVAAPAGAATSGACPDAAGVTVVVDFHELGGGVVVRCAGSAVGSGAEALQRAGFTVTEPLRTPGFVCRIDGKPGADREACVDTPPTSAYWSYWRADRGGSWSYSSQGASATRPAQVEGWSFALDRSATAVPPPGVAPPPVASPTTTRAPGPTPEPPHAGPVSHPPASGPSRGPSVAGATTIRPTPPGSPTSSPPPSTPAGSTAATTTTAPAEDPPGGRSTLGHRTVEVAAAGASSSPDRSGSGPGAGALVAVVVVAGLVATAVVRSRRQGSAGGRSRAGR